MTRLDGDFAIEPGDEVQEQRRADRSAVRRTDRRAPTATVVRANALERAWTRLVGNLELTELYDVSFTERRML